MAAAAAYLYQPANFPNIRVSTVGLLTIHDQKTTSVMCGKSGMKNCPLCHSSPKDFMKPTSKYVVKDPAFLEFGISPLHFGMFVLIITLV